MRGLRVRRAPSSSPCSCGRDSVSVHAGDLPSTRPSSSVSPGFHRSARRIRRPCHRSSRRCLHARLPTHLHRRPRRSRDAVPTPRHASNRSRVPGCGSGRRETAVCSRRRPPRAPGGHVRGDSQRSTRRRTGAIGVASIAGSGLAAGSFRDGATPIAGTPPGLPRRAPTARATHPPAARWLRALGRVRVSTGDDHPVRFNRGCHSSMRDRPPTRHRCRTRSRSAVDRRTRRRPRHRSRRLFPTTYERPGVMTRARDSAHLWRPRCRAQSSDPRAGCSRSPHDGALPCDDARRRTRPPPRPLATSGRRPTPYTDAGPRPAHHCVARRATPRIHRRRQEVRRCAALRPANCDKSMALALRSPAMTSRAR